MTQESKLYALRFGFYLIYFNLFKSFFNKYILKGYDDGV
jgi:hypothetical protein